MNAPGEPSSPGACLFCQAPCKLRSKICGAKKCRHRQINESARRKRLGEKADKVYFCKCCKAQLPPRKLGEWQRTRFCSDACTARFHARKARKVGFLKKWGATAPAFERCLFEPCGRRFRPPKTAWGTKLYCTDKCRARAAQEVAPPRAECEMCERPLGLVPGRRVDLKVCSERCFRDRASLRRRVKRKNVDRRRALRNMISFAKAIIESSVKATQGEWNVWGVRHQGV